MACPGTKHSHTCGSVLYRCKSCGNVGCDQGTKGTCSNQAFTGGKCMKCGKSGQKEIHR